MLHQLAASGGHHTTLGHWGFAVVGALWIVLGGLQAAKPDVGWRMRRWQYRNPAAVQPSDRAVKVTRVAGSVAVVAGIALVVAAVVTA
ncbi:DUF6199 family natural product biosynthesis protein [Jatrophihabitans sp. YIM 134969]